MKGDVDVSIIQADFDRLALLSREEWDHNSHYHGFLLKHVPPHCSNALELGCGTGTFARLLAERAEHVLTLNLSPQMIRIAQERLGHSSIAITLDTYSHVLPSMHQDVARKLDDLFED